MKYSSSNVFLGIHLKEDNKLFFGTDNVVEYPYSIRYEQLLRELGYYPTANEAKRAGFSGDIPEGFECITLKKGTNLELCTLKIKPVFKNYRKAVLFVIRDRIEKWQLFFKRIWRGRL